MSGVVESSAIPHQHIGAVRILIQSLATADPKLVESVHKELVKLTGKDLGQDPRSWQRWLGLQEKICAGKVEPESPTAPLDQEMNR